MLGLSVLRHLWIMISLDPPLVSLTDHHINLWHVFLPRFSLALSNQAKSSQQYNKHDDGWLNPLKEICWRGTSSIVNFLPWSREYMIVKNKQKELFFYWHLSYFFILWIGGRSISFDYKAHFQSTQFHNVKIIILKETILPTMASLSFMISNSYQIHLI